MSQQELLKRVIEVLDASGAQYMLVGSHASSLQGAARLTHDIDLVVVLPPNAAHELAAAFPLPTYYLDEQSVLEAIRKPDQFTDALRVYEVQYGDLDLPYIEKWAKELNVESEWERLKREALPEGD